MIFIKYFKDLYKQYGIITFLLMVSTMLFLITLCDYFNLFTFIYDKLNLPIIICVIFFLVIRGLSLKLHSLFFLKSVNYIDFYSLSILVSILLYKLILNIFEDVLMILPYKITWTNIIIIILGILLIIRYFYIMIIETKNKNQTEKNIFDLKQLYDDEIPEQIEFILINDEAANYDLLERDKIINQMANTIINCNNNSKFVMSLKGGWGSGKTTILNNRPVRQAQL